MDNIQDIEIILKGIITGVLAVYAVIYALRPAVMYPDYILDVVDNPWVFVILLILNYYVSLWDTTIALLMLLTLVAMMMDVVLFTEGFKIDITDINSLTGIENMKNMMISDQDLNTIILGRLQEQRIQNGTDSLHKPRPFV